MKTCSYIFFLSAFLILFQSSYSQKLSIGIGNGTNFSDAHGNFTSGNWKSKSGPLSSLYINYALSQHFSIQTEFNYSDEYYKYDVYNSPYYYYSVDKSYIIAPIAYNSNLSWDLKLYRIPLFFTVTTGSKLQLGISAGGYISFLDSYDGTIPFNSYIDLQNSYYPSYANPIKPAKFDYGMLYGLKLSYPISEHFRVFADGRYLIGKKKNMDYQSLHIGAKECMFGISFSGFSKKNPNVNLPIATPDTSNHKLLLSFRAGYSVSWNGGDNNHNSYKQKGGAVTGLSLEYMLDKNFSLQMDALFQRLGYNMNDSSILYYRYDPGHNQYSNTSVDLDYLEVPLMFKIKFGNKIRFYINTGPYFGMLLSARVSGTAYYANFSQSGYNYIKVNVNDRIDTYLRSVDAGWVYGIGCKIPLGKRIIFDTELRYLAGNRNAFDSNQFYDGQNTISDQSLHNQAVSLMFGVNIAF